MKRCSRSLSCQTVVVILAGTLQTPRSRTVGAGRQGARWFGPRSSDVSYNLNQSQGGMYIEVAMMISWVALVNRSHPYLENDPAP